MTIILLNTYIHTRHIIQWKKKSSKLKYEQKMGKNQICNKLIRINLHNKSSFEAYSSP